MLNASDEFKEKVAQNSTVLVKAVLTLADGTEQALTGDDFMSGSLSFSESTSSTSGFDIGAAVIGKFDCTLNNMDGRFDAHDFTGASIAPSIGAQLADGTVEWVRKGIYRVEQPSSYGRTVSLECYDNLSLLERDYSEVTTKYPATLRTIVRDVCSLCGLSIAAADFKNSTWTVQSRPEDDMTCLDVVAYAAQVACCWAKVDSLGRLAFGWYDPDAFSWAGDDYDGGEVADYTTGDELDGGTMASAGDDADGSDEADGGGLTSYDGDAQAVEVKAISSMTVGTDEVVVTGVRVLVEGDGDEDDGEGFWGEEGYVLGIESNPFIAASQAQAAAEQIGRNTVSLRFYVFDVSAVANPFLEAGDPVVLVDERDKRRSSYVTSLTYKPGSYQALSCSAETPARNSAATYDATTRAYLKAHGEIARERTAREQAVADMNDRLSKAGGLFSTEEVQEDGSVIYYMHDKPTLDESGVVWKMTADALGMSTDGGKTYPYALSVDGDAILERVYAVGLDASYITTGELVVKDPSTGKIAFSADVATGHVYVSGDSVYVESKTLTSTVNGITSDMAVLEQSVDGLRSTVSSLAAQYGTCGTASAIAVKQVSCEGFDSLMNGAAVTVKFTYGNSASSPQLKIGDTAAKPIFVNGSAIKEDSWWQAGALLTFVYDGAVWNCVSGLENSTMTALVNRVSKVEQTADGLTSAVSAQRVAWGTCSSSASSWTKVVTAPGFTLYEGSEITVKFTYENKATKPILNVNGTGAALIYVNDEPIPSAYWWQAGGVMTFRYDGLRWVVIDSSTLSLIKQTADSITLSVAGSLGDTASIQMTVNGKTNIETLDLSGVRKAFASDSSAITISAGTVTFNSNTFVVNSTNFKVTSTGVITATSGTIGGFTIGSSYLRYLRTSHSGNTKGVFLDTNGISTSGGSSWMAMASGALYGSGSSSETAYLEFNRQNANNSVYGLRIMGKGYIGIGTSGFLGVAAYSARGGNSVTFTSGTNGTIKGLTKMSSYTTTFASPWCLAVYNTSTKKYGYMSSVTSVVTTLNWATSNVTFTKGLMTSAI